MSTRAQRPLHESEMDNGNLALRRPSVHINGDVEQNKRHQRRRAAAEGVLRKQVSQLKTLERCRNCGKLITFPSMSSRYMYLQCPLCDYQIPEPSALSIPTPHPSMPDKLPYSLCAARININGEARRCERRRVGHTDLCKGHNRIVARFGKLTYGKYDEPYCEIHEIQLRDPEDNDDEIEEQRELTHDEKVEAAKKLEKESSIGTADTIILERARQVWLRREQKGTLKKDPLSTEIITNIIEPTFGLDIAKQGPGRKRWLKNSFQAIMSLSQAPLSILVAMIGHRSEPGKARDVINSINQILSKYGGQRFYIPSDVNILELLEPEFGGPQDPCPGETKFLRIRYCLQGVVGEVSARLLDDEGYSLTEPILVEVPPVASKQRTTVAGRSLDVGSRLTVIKALYGHLHDFSCAFNVTEKVQGLVDMRGRGQYLRLTNEDQLNDIFGDPTKAIEKVFKVTYKVDAREGEILAPEAHDKLVNRVYVAAPVVGPHIIVNSATLTTKSSLGRSNGGFVDRRAQLINYAAFSKHKRRTRGSHRQASMNTITETLSIDVADQVRGLIASQGGDTLTLHAGSDIFHALSQIKDEHMWREKFRKQDLMLHLELRANNVLREVHVFTNSEYSIREDVHVDARPVTPSILILAAIYGHPTDPKKQFNVQPILEERIRQRAGRILCIEASESLTELFGDPCYPYKTNKILQIRYQVKELMGRLQAQVKTNGMLHQSIQIGWPTKQRTNI